MPEAMETGIAQMENHKWTMARTERNNVIVVFEAPNRKSASDLQSAVLFEER